MKSLHLLKFNLVSLFTLSTTLVILCFGAISEAADDCELEVSGIYVSFSSEADITDSPIAEERTVLRWIELHWWGQEDSGSNWVGLWDHEPLTTQDNDTLDFTFVTTVDGGYQTQVRWNTSEFPTDIQSADGCLPLWGGVISGGEVVLTKCLRLEPNWMWRLRPYIGDLGITNVLLPGSHDAGAYDGVHLVAGNEVAKWTFTQDESLWQQFVMGTRYVDIRISYYENTEEKFHINHGDVRIRPLESYLNDVTSFINNTQEILIFDIHSFSVGFNATTNNLLIALLESTFGYAMAPKALAPNPTLNDLWAMNRRLIVTYPHRRTHNSEYFWDNVEHVYGDVNNLDDLYDYMDENITSHAGSSFMWSAMTEFTPSALDVTVNRWEGGLRGAANDTNDAVTLWLRREWWTMVNIIAMDFFGSSGIVDVILEANIVRANFNCSTIF